MSKILDSLKDQYFERFTNKAGHYQSNNRDASLIGIGYNDAKGAPDVVRWAKGFCLYFQESEIDILPNEILVGYFTNGKSKSSRFNKVDGAISGHFSVDYPLMLELGVDGIFQRIEFYRNLVLNQSSVDPRSEAFFNACKLVWQGFQTYLLRYQEKLKKN